MMNKYFKILLPLLMIVSINTIYAQVKVGDNPMTLNPSAVLEVESSNKGLLMPRVALTLTTSAAPLAAHVAGMTVYNTATANDVVPGVYFNDGTKWIKVENNGLQGTTAETNVLSNIINTSILGYNPSGSAANAPAAGVNYAGTGISITDKTCFPFISGPDFNNHIYCFFNLSAKATWVQHFDMAKEMGGYLATLTTAGERSFINSKLPSFTSNIWIGYAIRKIPGNPSHYTWITGEEWTTNWAGATGSGAPIFSDPFASGEPSNGLGLEGCTHIIVATSSPSRQWNDNGCLDDDAYGSNGFNQLLVEFNK